MNVPEDLQGMYNHCLELASKDVEHISISPEMMLALIERISDLQTDSINLESYVHYECRKKLAKVNERANDLEIDIGKLKQDIVDASTLNALHRL